MQNVTDRHLMTEPHLNTITRRQREFQQREELFLATARNILRADGMASLTMERIADLTEYAKGTVYKHFTCKEDILCALCNESLLHMSRLFHHAVLFEGTSRERLMALGGAYQLYTVQFPEEFDLLIATRTNNIRQKASARRVEAMGEADLQVHAVMRTLISDAIACGDLTVPPGMQVDEICFGLWGLSFGVLVLDQAKDAISSMELPPITQVMFNQLNRLLDGYAWTPLSTEHDYSQTVVRVLQHLEPYI